MKIRWLIALLSVMACAGLVCAQGGVINGPIQILGPTGRPLPGATVTFCTSAGTGFPCTPLASIYTDAGLTIPAANPTVTDGLGNLPQVYAAPGVYKISVTGTGITPTLITGSVAGTGGGNVVNTGTYVWNLAQTFNGGILANTTQTNSKYAAEFTNSGAFSRGQLRIGQPNAETGLTISSSIPTNAFFAVGAVQDNSCGTFSRALSTSGADFHMGPQLWEWHDWIGETVGNCIVSLPLRMTLTGNQLSFNLNGIIPALTVIQESPNPATGIYFSSDPGVGFVVNNGSGTPLDQWRIIANQLNPQVDNQMSIGTAAKRVKQVYLGNNGFFFHSGAVDIAGMQSDGSGNLFIGNSNAGDISILPGGSHIVRIPTQIGNVAGTAVMGLTLKKGSGAGNYTTASTTYVVVDSTNLCNTVTIPTGWKLSVAVSGSIGTATAAVLDNFALTDNAACGTANAGILVEGVSTTTAAGVLQPFALNWVITGDGASHNIALQYKTSAGADSATILNSSGTSLPTMVFTLMPSN